MKRKKQDITKRREYSKGKDNWNKHWMGIIANNGPLTVLPLTWAWTGQVMFYAL